MKFRLTQPHIINDAQVEIGTVIGDDTGYPMKNEKGERLIVPSANMEPLDDEAKQVYGDIRKAKAEQGITWGSPLEDIPIRVAGASPPVQGQHINRSPQPIIPSPIEHLTHPTDLRPGEQPGLKVSPEALTAAADARNAERDKLEAVKSNEKQDSEQKDRLGDKSSTSVMGEVPTGTTRPLDKPKK